MTWADLGTAVDDLASQIQAGEFRPLLPDGSTFAARAEARFGLLVQVPGARKALEPAVAVRARSVAAKITLDGAAIAARRLVEERG